MLGSRAAALNKKIESERDEAIGGLPKYIRFCQRVSELAVHEGKKLHFDIVVGDGLFASARLMEVSSFPEDALWEVASVDRDGSVRADERVVSYVVGNYSFLQQKGALLFGSREGRLLYLARALDSGQAPEQITAALSAARYSKRGQEWLIPSEPDA